MANLFDTASPAIQQNMIRDVQEMARYEAGHTVDELQAAQLARKILARAKSREALYHVSTARIRQLVDELEARHATKKKSPAQLQREIDEVIAKPSSKFKSAVVLVYSRPSGYWYAQARDAMTGAQITDASGYSREDVLRSLRGKFAMIGVTIKSITDEDPYAAGAAMAVEVRSHATMKTTASFKQRPAGPKKKTPTDHELFYLSEDQQGGKHAVHFERFDRLVDAVDMLGRLPHGSITFGTARTGPQFMIAWAAPEHTDMIHWTDGDLNAQPYIQGKTRTLREEQAPRAADSMQFFEDRLRRARARGR